MTARDYYLERAVDCALAAETTPCDRDVLLRMASTYVLIAVEIDRRCGCCKPDTATTLQGQATRRFDEIHVVSNRPNDWVAECHHAIRSAIGQQLRNRCELIEEVPHQLLAILVQLTEHPTGGRAIN
jgi:hypothetical protein